MTQEEKFDLLMEKYGMCDLHVGSRYERGVLCVFPNYQWVWLRM